MRMRALFIGLGVLAVLVAAAFAFLLSSAGQSFVTARLIEALAGPDQTIAIAETDGGWPSYIVWRDVSVADRNGVWLTLDRIELRWNPTALVRGRLAVEALEVGTARMMRQPVRAAQPPSTAPPDLRGVADTLTRITVDQARVGALILDPPVIGRPVDAALSARLAPDLRSRLNTLALDVQLRQAPGGGTFRIAAGPDAFVVRVNAAAENISANGAVSLNHHTNALSGALKLNCTAAPCYAASDVRLGTLSADMVLSGALDAPVGRFDFRAQDAAYADRRIASTEGRIAVQSKPESGPGAIAVTGTGTASGLVAAVPEAVPLVADSGQWSFALTRLPDESLVLDHARIMAGDLTLESAAFTLAPNRAPTQFTVAATGAGRLLGQEDTRSRMTAVLRVNSITDGGGAGRLTVTADDLPEVLQATPLSDARLSLATDVTLSPQRVVFANLNVESGNLAARGTSTWSRQRGFDHQSSRLTLRLPSWPDIMPEETQADVVLTGGLADIRAELSATAPALLLPAAPVDDVVVTAEVNRTAQGFIAVLQGTGRWFDGSLSFAANVTQDTPGTIQLNDLALQSETVAVSGTLAVATDGPTVTGDVQARLADLAPWIGGTGSANAQLTFTQQDTQVVDLAFAATNLNHPALRASRLSGEGRVTDLWSNPTLNVAVDGTGARLLDRPLSALTVRVAGTPAALTVDLEAKGAAGVPVSAAAAAELAFGPTTTVTLQSLAWEDGALRAVLAAPATLTTDSQALVLAPFRLTVTGGTGTGGDVTGSFRWDKNQDVVNGALAAHQVALPLAAALPGQSTNIVLDGEAAMSGSRAAVDIKARLEGVLPAARDFPAVTMVATLAMTGGQARVDVSAEGLSAQPLLLRANFPARLDLTETRLVLATDQPISGRLTWQGPLAPLWRLVPADIDVVTGDVAVDASLSGTLDLPVFTGGLKLSDGFYENFAGGTVLRNITAAVEAAGPQGFTLSLSAQDMNDGTLTLAGRVAGMPEFAADVTVDLVRLDVLQRDDVVASATGNLNYAGPLLAGRLTGDVQVVNALVRLGGSYVPDIPLLRPLPGFERAGNDDFLSGIALEVAVNTSNPVRIEGEGLDSVWRGRLDIAGTLARPDIRGSLALDRGSFSFLGQSFVLNSGTVTFTGGGNVDPQLSIVAVRETSDITATVTITGRARAPQVALSSQPVLPRDEVLARLLFRKGTGELGPLESIQLASAASDLAGLSDGGINGLLRRTFGVDVSAGADGDSVVVGRQFGRNLYVSVGQNLDDQTREIIVEWRLSRAISLKSTTNDVTGADIGVFWRKDY